MRKKKGLQIKVIKQATYLRDTIVTVHKLKNCFVIFTKHYVYVWGIEKEVNKFMREVTIKSRRDI